MSRSSVLSLDISVPLTQRPLSYLGAAGRARGRATAVPWWRCPTSPEAGGPWRTLGDPALQGRPSGSRSPGGMDVTVAVCLAVPWLRADATGDVWREAEASSVPSPKIRCASGPLHRTGLPRSALGKRRPQSHSGLAFSLFLRISPRGFSFSFQT